MKKFLTYLYFVTFGTLSFAGETTHVKYFQNDSTEIHRQIDYTDKNFATESRFEDRIGLEYGVIKNQSAIQFAKISFMKGYNFNPYFYLGVGTGFKLYFGNKNTYNFTEVTPSLPLFASFRLNFVNAKFTPYLAIDAGYVVTTGIDGPRFFYNPTFGFRFPVGNKFKMNIGVGYEKQMLEKYSYSDSETYIESLNINMGLSF